MQVPTNAILNTESRGMPLLADLQSAHTLLARPVVTEWRKTALLVPFTPPSPFRELMRELIRLDTNSSHYLRKTCVPVFGPLGKTSETYAPRMWSPTCVSLGADGTLLAV